jgi:hypothetical protein
MKALWKAFPLCFNSPSSRRISKERSKKSGCHKIPDVEGFYTPFNVHQIMGKIFPNPLFSYMFLI